MLLSCHSYEIFFPLRQVRKNVLYKVTPIDLPLMDLIFSPHLLYSLIHITTIWSLVTLTGGKIFYLKDWHFHLEINYTPQKCCRHFGALSRYVQSLLFFPTAEKDSGFPSLFYFFMKFVSVCRADDISLKFWYNNTINISTLLQSNFTFAVSKLAHIQLTNIYTKTSVLASDIVRGNCCALLFDQAMEYLCELNPLFELKIDDVTHQWSNPLGWKSPPRQHSLVCIQMLPSCTLCPNILHMLTDMCSLQSVVIL